MGTSSSASRQALPSGLRLRPKRRPVPIWLGVLAIVAAGLLLGVVVAGAPKAAVLGTLAALVAIAAAAYRPAFGLAVLAVAYPFDLTTYAGPVKLTTGYALLAILVAVSIGRQLLRNPPRWQKTSLDWPVAAFAALTILSILSLTGNYQDQLIAQVKAAGGLLLFFLTVQSLRRRSDVWLVLGAVVASGLIQAAVITMPVLSGARAITDATRAQGTLNDPNILSGYLVLIMLLVLGVGLTVRNRWLMGAAALILLVYCVALVATLSRSGWLGFLVGAVALLFLLPGRRRQVAVAGGAIAMAILIFGLVSPIGGRLTDGTLVETLSARWDIWVGTVQMIAHHPVFGVGLANFVNFLPVYTGVDYGLEHAHNIFLNMAAERGLPALVAFVVVLVLVFRSLKQASRWATTGAERALVAALTASLIGYLVHSLFDVSYYDYKVLLLFWLVVGVGASLPSVLSVPALASARSLGGELPGGPGFEQPDRPPRD